MLSGTKATPRESWSQGICRCHHPQVALLLALQDPLEELAVDADELVQAGEEPLHHLLLEQQLGHHAAAVHVAHDLERADVVQLRLHQLCRDNAQGSGGGPAAAHSPGRLRLLGATEMLSLGQQLFSLQRFPVLPPAPPTPATGAGGLVTLAASPSGFTGIEIFHNLPCSYFLETGNSDSS